ncbi:Protein GrpE [Aquisphaera giovannonii]|uniref:Protein GrpE n=1 Tax=Aquisphaera giovannonii TaxID=406548 RepID=A0A5B9WAY8_9BACT|nr:nucleotide exchange factor GrpE [Aquisphaera giovannonii]QEH37746.1 Protein GrpE [Aquisphaera giovannonii]
MPENERSDEGPSKGAEGPGPGDTGEWPQVPAGAPLAEGPEPAEGPRLSEVPVPLDVEEEEEETEEVMIPHMLRPHPEPPAVDSTARIAAAISQLGIALEQKFSTLQAIFDREVRAETARERVVDRLHAELQEYKQDLLLKVQRPIFIDLIQLHDDIGKMADAQPAEDEARSAAVRGAFESIRTAIEDILYRQGVEPYRNEAEEFDPRRQRAVTTVPTDLPEQTRTVAVRHRPGFQAGDKVIRPEIVSVYMLRK